MAELTETDAVVSSSESKQRFKLGEFEGPLDLLLFLIRKNEVNIYDIPIAEITDQYISYLEYATSIDLDDLTEFYLLASTLLYIKSQMLLPVEVDFGEEYEDPRQELVERLIEYQKFKEISKLMEEKERASEWTIERKKKQRTLPFSEEDDIWEQIEVWDLLKSFSTMIGTLSHERIIDLYEEVTINEKISLIHELLEGKDHFLFTDLIKKETSTMEVVCAFLAILESVKIKLISIFQNRLFGDIQIRKRVPLPGEHFEAYDFSDEDTQE
ncbi:segregation and condensation protein A [Sediminispirochaeta bajacaliforniensis]|jgi:segregation and condensation protein A|uniref:segregation and condensation protein A n=1 Tax=Sediminispirochaeta bajacaliforniensis TaxID=148 RepID=UPI00036D8FD2|nr:segregation/condensation protein A [Sediminispirochaeta bajacaliforniensis]